MSNRKIGRREAIAVMGAAGAAVAFGCAENSPIGPSTPTTASSGTVNAACAETPTKRLDRFRR
jgi:hypothetical protein